MGTVVQTGDLKFVKVNDNNLLVSLQSLTTTNGESPLSLPESAGLNLSNYQINGQTVQQSPLPTGYTQVEYLQSTGTQYIDTGFIPNQDTRTEMKFALDNITNADYWIFGARTSSAVNEYRFNAYGQKWWTDYNTYIYSFGTIDTNTHVINKDKNLTYFDNTLVDTATYATFSAPVTMYIFSANNNGAPTSQLLGKIYYTKIYDNGTLIRNFIPAIRTSDSVAGMYDTVNKVFYTNAGTGTFTTGGVISNPTPEVPWEIENLGYENLCQNILTPGTTGITSGVNYTVNDDLSITLNGTGTSDAVIFLKQNDNVNSNPLYVLEKGKTYTEHGVQIWYFLNSTGTTNHYFGGLFDDTETIVPAENILIMGFRIYIKSGAVYDNVTVYPMLNEGFSVLPYVPYGKAGVQVESRGKNLFDYTKLNTNTAGGVTITNNNDGSFTVSGATTSTVYGNVFYIATDLIKSIGPGYYIISGVNNTDSPYVYLSLYYGEGKFQHEINTRYGNSMLITEEMLSYQDFIARIGIYFADNVPITLGNIYPQLEFSKAETTFEPYKTPYLYPITLNSPLKKVGNVSDYIDYANQRVVRNVGEVVFDGTETISNQFLRPDSSGNLLVQYDCDNVKLTENGAYTNGVCSHLKTIPADIQWGGMQGFSINKQARVSFLFTGITDITSFKSYLVAQYAAGTPVTVQYQLATPTYEYYDVENLLNIPAATGTYAGLTFNYYSDGRITVTGTATATGPIAVTGPHSLIDPGTYAFSVKRIKGNAIVWMNYYEGSTWKGEFNTYDNQTQTSGSGLTINNIGINAVAGTTYDEEFYPMLETGSVIHPYVPYGSPTPSLPTIESATGNGSLYATDGTLRSSWIKTNYWRE